MANAPSNKMQRRIQVILFCMAVVGFSILLGRLYYLQIVEGDKYQKLALSQQMRSTTISAERGEILDTNGKVLARSAQVWNVILSPADVKDDAQLNQVADFLSELLDVDRQKIIDKGKNKKMYYERVKSKVEKDVADQITQFCVDNKITCINLEEDTRRYYPYGHLASTVLGFTGSENKGAYGLEAYYDKYLSGTPGRVVAAKNAWGSDLPYRYQQLYDAQDGCSIVLTIDEVVQHFLEKHLETAVTEHNVQNRAAGIVMNVKTGEILAMATKPDFDPNEPLVIADPKTAAALEELKKTATDEEYAKALQEAQFVQWNNKAVQEPYEPGSVFKIITAAGALESGAVHGGDVFNCPGYHIVAGRKVHCWKNGGHGTITFVQGIMGSCNPTFMMVGEKMGAETFYEYFENFGLTEPTGIDFPGEADSNYHSMERLRDEGSGAYLASSSFGQTFKVTPIQLITAVSAAVNGGKLMQPYLVKQILDADGNVIKTTQPVVKRQVISESISKELAGYLELVVSGDGGSGKSAKIPGYRIGGKTGTSEKLDKLNEYGQVQERIASFYGFAPADDPQIAVLILLDEPHMDNIYGSVIAAPVVQGILADVLPYMGIDPVYTAEELEKKEVSTPYLLGYRPHEATSELIQQGLKSKVVGDGPTVLKQIPAVSQPIPKGGTVILYTDESELSKTVTVPNVVGLSGQQANRTILNAGLNISVSGVEIDSAGCIAARQSPEAGTEVEIGTVVTVEFINKDLAG